MKLRSNILLSLLLIATLLLAVMSCSLSKAKQDNDTGMGVKIERYDQLECRFLTAGDYSALQQMNTTYPTETRTLLEDVLQLGTVDDHTINERFLKFYQDPTLQTVLAAVTTQYQNVEDIEAQLAVAYKNMRHFLPEVDLPVVYFQVGALGQSIIVGNDNTIGICLDKYLGKDFSIYKRYYMNQQIEQMERSYIVPDILTFYLISQYPMRDFEHRTQAERDQHVARIHWVVNTLMKKNFYTDKGAAEVGKYMVKNPNKTIHQLLSMQ